MGLAGDMTQGKDEDVAKTYQLGPVRRTVNVLMTALLRLGVGDRSTYLLTTTGRKTGRPRTTPVILVEAGGERWLVSPYGLVGWVHNVRARPEVSLRRGRTTQVLHAEEVGSASAGPVLQRYVRQVRVTAPFFDAKAGDPVQDFAAEGARHPVFKLTEDAPAP
jgi:deazaflavin-dependent oxidoreductase (nitroreductase family)